ncbi:MAG: histidine phosphatase family protein [Planctomycetales bacterium]|nr:histidine phosphatase family protein [Planctomycetales bacterium]
MLRRLIIMRHAKSSWKEPGATDHERPLNKRGQREAPVVAAHLQEIGWTPEVVLCSDATRTRETAELMLETLQPRPAPSYYASLYLGGIHELREAVAALPDDVKIALALGHNPGWEGAVHWLSGQSVELATSNAALLEFHGDTWRAALQGEHAWHLVDVVRPKALLSAD